MFGPSQVAASISTRVVRVVDLRARAAHHAGDRRRAVGVVDDAPCRGRARALRRRASSTCSPSRAAAHDEPAAGDAVEVEGVQRLAGQQHHVVGDVDDVVDRPLAGGDQPRLQPRRRRADRHVLEGARGEARAQVGCLDVDLDAGDRVAGGPRVVGPRRRRQRRAGRRVDLARDAVDAEAVRPVGRDLELEHVGGDRQHLGQRRARAIGVASSSSTMIPSCVGADRELVLGQDHPLRLDRRAAWPCRASCRRA